MQNSFKIDEFNAQKRKNMQAREMLRELQSIKGVSLTKLAKQIGITQSTVQRIATGKTKHCHADTYITILEFYNQTKTPSDN
ncbi:helix-turn-helix transcriptional regulator [Moraxella nasovis]|uniref:helix-turn-helix domain-containing protein n=1 Tax=Moraxella nasovis TaxID=2904121 RepID=UPI001F60E829|nr:helix-turn-helix transcriptional regulator [Moraxella nasovis]UNU74138.1 helix-turn-helix transcriptional regulator [Moraxella nasovis]